MKNIDYISLKKISIQKSSVRGLVTTFTIFVIALIIILRYLATNIISLNWDFPIMFDGAYRVTLGQRPSVDFSTPLGPLVFIIGAIGMKLTTVSLPGLNIGYMLFGICVLATVLSAIRHLPYYIISLVAIYSASFIFMPRMLSYPALEFGYTGIYNVFGYSLLFLLSLYTFNTTAYAQYHLPVFLRGVLSGVIIMLMSMLKITFGVAGIFLVLLWSFYERGYRTFLFGILGGGVVVTTCFYGFYLNFNFSPIYRDLQITLISRLSESPFTSLIFIYSFLNRTALDNIFIVACSLLLCFLFPSDKSKIASYGFLLIFLGYFLSASIMQPPEHVLSSFYALFALNLIVTRGGHLIRNRSSLVSFNWLRGLVIFLSLTLLVKFVGTNVFGLIYRADILVHRAYISKTFTGLSYDKEWTKQKISKFINKEVAARCSSTCKLLTVGVNNLYPYYNNTIPVQNTLLYWHHGVTFSRNLQEYDIDYFDTEQLFRDIDYIYLTPEHPESKNEFLYMYGDFININYLLIESSDDGILFKRKN